VSSFVHLHVHSEFSLLDGLAKLPALCEAAKEQGMDALALTDHGSMYGTIQFYLAAKKAGVHPIYGCEVYQAARTRKDQDPQKDRPRHHLVLLARNMTGYQNLLQLVTKANLEGLYYKPRIDDELLIEHAEGLICLSACISGEIPKLIRAKMPERARERIGFYKDLFGADNYFIELQQHTGVPDLEWINPQLIQMAREAGLGLVATNDVHYARQEDFKAQELLLAMQTQTTMADPKRMRMGGNDYYLKSPDEMAAMFPEYPETVENSLRIAEACQVDLERKEYHLPTVEVPEGFTSETYLRHLVDQGLERCYQEITDEIRERAAYELSVIHRMGFDDYMLINADLVRWCKEEAKMLVGPGRGSGASSLVGYALGITALEPLSLGLIFERFLNPGRVSMPDIDLDYPEDRRQEVIDYLTRRYGEDKTSQIATFGTMAARGSIRDVGRALGVPLEDVDRVAKLVPSGPKQTIQKALKEVAELQTLYTSTAWVRQLLDYAIDVEGVTRHLSTHAAGVLIADKPLVSYTPLQRAPRGEGLISQYCMEDVDEIGLLKLDVLGLSTLTILDRAFRWIERTSGVQLTQESIPLDDPDTYGLLSTGEVTGVFQVESSGMRRVLREMQPTEFRDVEAILALYRPGPMEYIDNYVARKFGREPISYHHPMLEPILRDTYGIIVYQEQVIRIASELAGYSPGDADIMRRAVGKKKEKEMKKQHTIFVAGCGERGIEKDVAEQIWADIETFANYGFNKSHAAAYAVITLQTAYLKAHYPVEYMAALLSVQGADMDKLGILVSECRRLEIDLRPPDVNRSEIDFIVEPKEYETLAQRDCLAGCDSLAIRFGLGAIKNVGDGPAQELVTCREGRPFADLDDLIDRADLRHLNKRVLECMVRAGVLDDFGERNALLDALDRMIATSQEIHRAREIGQFSLFGPTAQDEGIKFALSEVPPLPDRKRAADERELLGACLTSHPLDAVMKYVDDRLTPLGEIDAAMVNQTVQVVGMLEGLRGYTTKSNQPMAFARLEDLTGGMDMVVFPQAYDAYRDFLSDAHPLLVTAKVNLRNDEVNLVAEEVARYRVPQGAPLRDQPQRAACGVSVEIPLDRGAEQVSELVDQVLDVTARFGGDVPFSFRLRNGVGHIVIGFPDRGVCYSDQLVQQVSALVGSDHLTVDWA